MIYALPGTVARTRIRVCNNTDLAVGTVLHRPSPICPTCGGDRLAWGPWGHEYVCNCMRNSSIANICMTVLEEKSLQPII